MDIKETYSQKSNLTEKQVVEIFRKPKLLVIDEISERAETDWENLILVHLIDKRYDSANDTILIGNFTRDNFIKSVGASISSRITECGGIIECNWDSLR
jgi:DNA replication protein DnaC